MACQSDVEPEMCSAGIKGRLLGDERVAQMYIKPGSCRVHNRVSFLFPTAKDESTEPQLER